MQRAAAEAYKTQAIMTASPAKLVAMCYDRAILALNDSVRAIEAGDIQARFNHSARAADIVAHLWSTLDLDKGGEIARNLSSIYGFVMNRLPDINMKNDPQAARDVVDVLEPLRQSWTELAKRGEGAGAAAMAAATAQSARAAAAAPRRAAPAPAANVNRAAGAGFAISI